MWLLVGIPIGIISAIKRGTLIDKAAMGRALMAISAPVYWLGLVSIYLFSEDLGKLSRSSRAPARTRRLHIQDPVGSGPGADPALARPRGLVRGDLRPLPARATCSR